MLMSQTTLVIFVHHPTCFVFSSNCRFLSFLNFFRRSCKMFFCFGCFLFLLADLVVAALSRTKNTYRTMTTSFDEAELDLNEGLHKLHQMVAAMA